MNYHVVFCLGILLSVLVGCGRSGFNPTLLDDHQKPVASRIVSQALQPMSFAKASHNECSATGRLVPTIISAIAGELADFALKYLNQRLKEQLAKYTRETSLLSESQLPTEGSACVAVKYKLDPILLLKVQTYPGTGIKLQPIWFDPSKFQPKIASDADKVDSETIMAVVMSVQPIYFVQSTRRKEIPVQVISTKLPLSVASESGLLIRRESRPRFSDMPMMAAPPPGQTATFKIDVATAIEPPFLISSLERVLSNNLDDLSESLAEALLQLAGLDEEE